MILQVMVFRRRNQSSIRPVHRIKHVTDRQGGIALGVNLDEQVVTTIDAPTLAATNSVETGCTINAIYLRVEVTNDGATAVLPNAYLMVMKNPGGNLTFPNPNVVGASDNKKYVIHQEMVMLQMVENSNPRTLFNGVIVIPKGYRRFAINDLLTVRVFSPSIALFVCIQCHYKEFR